MRRRRVAAPDELRRFMQRIRGSRPHPAQPGGVAWADRHSGAGRSRRQKMTPPMTYAARPMPSRMPS